MDKPSKKELKENLADDLAELAEINMKKAEILQKFAFGLDTGELTLNELIKLYQKEDDIEIEPIEKTINRIDNE